MKEINDKNKHLVSLLLGIALIIAFVFSSVSAEEIDRNSMAFIGLAFMFFAFSVREKTKLDTKQSTYTYWACFVVSASSFMFGAFYFG